MDGLALKIGEQWAKLAAGTSITITEKSPVFNDGNAFSIPFQLNAEMNRHLLGNATEVEGISFYEAIDRKPATLYVQGIPLFYGVIRLDSEEAAMEDGYIEVNLESGNLTFNDRIDGMNCRDVPLMDKIILGEKLETKKIYPFPWGYSFNAEDIEKLKKYRYFETYYPEAFQRMTVEGESTINDSSAYPAAKFCNMRICCPMPEELSDGEYAKSGNKDTSGFKTKADSLLSKGTDGVSKAGRYLLLDTTRKMSSPNFYVLYFLDCLFKHIGVSYQDGIAYMEDMGRLAMVNTNFGYDIEATGEEFLIKNVDYQKKENEFCDCVWEKTMATEIEYYCTAEIYRCIANSDNFPNEEVKKLIDALSAGFGIRFIQNRNGTAVKSVFIRDVLRSNQSDSVNASVFDVEKVDLNVRGFKLTYGGDDENTSYHYNDYSDYKLIDKFNEVVYSANATNKKLYIDKRNGNAYRIKIDDDAVAMEYANPTVMEVGEFEDATYGDCSDESLTETVEIGFTPAVMNDVSFKERKDAVEDKQSGVPINNRNPVSESTDEPFQREFSDDENNEQTFAFFLDVQMMYPSYPPHITVFDYAMGGDGRVHPAGFVYTFYNAQRYSENYSTSWVNVDGEYKYVKPVKYENKSPIHSYDCGLMLGIMRGPGNESGIEDIEENYDEEGNFKYVMTGKKSAFHSDICDNYNRLFDYNGTEQGGVDVSGRFSLKLRAEKPNPEGGFFPITDVNMQKRGLFDKFYAEYAHFVTHRKLLKMKLRIEMADLLRIDWSKRYTIGQYKGFINRYEYTVSDEGMGVVSLEMYTM